MINSKKMVMEQLENVAGGTYAQSHEIATFLTKAGYRGLFNGVTVNFNQLRSVVDSLGFECRDHGGLISQNTYVHKKTRKVYSQEDFKIALEYKFPGKRFA